LLQQLPRLLLVLLLVLLGLVVVVVALVGLLAAAFLPRGLTLESKRSSKTRSPTSSSLSSMLLL